MATRKTSIANTSLARALVRSSAAAREQRRVRTNSTVLATRVPTSLAESFKARCRNLSISPARALKILAETTDPDTVARLLRVLGLPDTASTDAVLDRVRAMIGADDSPDGVAPDAGGLGETADPSDPTANTGAPQIPQVPMHVGAKQNGRGTKQLSESDREGIKRFGSASAWAEAKRAAVRRA
jgi:hypothetical protein